MTGLQSDDPFLIVGHSLLALLAAGLGGVLAPLVAAVSRGRSGRPEAITTLAPLDRSRRGKPGTEGTLIMRKIRFTIGGLMAVVVVAAIDFAALRTADATWTGVLALLTYGRARAGDLRHPVSPRGGAGVVGRIPGVRLGLSARGTMGLRPQRPTADDRLAGVAAEKGRRAPYRSRHIIPRLPPAPASRSLPLGPSRPPSSAGSWRGPSSRRCRSLPSIPGRSRPRPPDRPGDGRSRPCSSGLSA